MWLLSFPCLNILDFLCVFICEDISSIALFNGGAYVVYYGMMDELWVVFWYDGVLLLYVIYGVYYGLVWYYGIRGDEGGGVLYAPYECWFVTFCW